MSCAMLGLKHAYKIHIIMHSYKFLYTCFCTICTSDWLDFVCVYIYIYIYLYTHTTISLIFVCSSRDGLKNIVLYND